MCSPAHPWRPDWCCMLLAEGEQESKAPWSLSSRTPPGASPPARPMQKGIASPCGAPQSLQCAKCQRSFARKQNRRGVPPSAIRHNANSLQPSDGHKRSLLHRDCLSFRRCSAHCSSHNPHPQSSSTHSQVRLGAKSLLRLWLFHAFLLRGPWPRLGVRTNVFVPHAVRA